MCKMQLKFTTLLVLFACLISSLSGKALRRRECYECEEEVWEEVPCNKIPSNLTRITPEPAPPVTYPKPQQPTKPLANSYKKSTPPPATSHSNTTRSPEFTIPKDPYKKCYLECKLGCKEFCSKVAINPSDKQIVQISKISEPATKGRIQLTHILRRELVANTDQSYNINDDYVSSEKPIVASHAPIYDPNADAFHSHQPYYSPENSDYYNVRNSLENILSRVSHAKLNPAQISLDASPLLSSYSAPTPVKNDFSQETNAHLDKPDDSIDAFISEYMNNNPTNQIHPKPSYSVSYNRL